MGVDLSTKTALVYDYGMFTYFAEALVPHFKQVYLHVPRESSFPKSHRYLIGSGLKGIIKVDEDDLWKTIRSVDIVCFPDVGDGSFAEDLRMQGIPVYSTGYSEKLEMDRLWFKEKLKSIGLPVIPHNVVTGVEALRKYCRDNKDVWIKISAFRGLGETRQNKNILRTEAWIDKLAREAGPAQRKMEFLVEKSVEAQEAGTDWFFSAGRHADQGCYGFEDKDKGYVCKVIKHVDIPAKIRNIDLKMAPIYKEMGCQSHISTEVRQTPSGIAYFTDSCQRQGSPPGELMPEFVANFGECVWKCAHNEVVTPEYADKYGAILMLYSDEAMDNYPSIIVPAQYRRFVKIRNPARVDGILYHVPQDNSSGLGAAIGYGKTLLAAQQMALEVADSIDADGLSFDRYTFDALDNTLTEANKLGIGFK